MLRLAHTYFILFALNIFGSVLCAQKDAGPPLKFGQVYKEDLALEVYEADPTANAFYIIRTKKTIIDATTKHIWHSRIKLLNEVGIEQFGEIRFPVFNSEYGRVTSFKAKVFFLINPF